MRRLLLSSPQRTQSSETMSVRWFDPPTSRIKEAVDHKVADGDFKASLENLPYLPSPLLNSLTSLLLPLPLAISR